LTFRLFSLGFFFGWLPISKPFDETEEATYIREYNTIGTREQCEISEYTRKPSTAYANPKTSRAQLILASAGK